MTRDEVSSLLIEKLGDLNLGLDLSEGSYVWEMVVDPLLDRLGLDPVTNDTRAFIRDRLATAHPTMTQEALSPYVSFGAELAEVVLEGVRREVLTARKTRSMAYPERLTEQEMDDIASPLLVDRETGGYAVVEVTVEFGQAQSVSIDGSVMVASKGGLKFYADELRRYSPTQMGRTSAGAYYLKFMAVAEQPGYQYNVEKGDIVAVYNLPGAIRAYNDRAATGGLPRDTNTQYKQRIENAIAERVPLTTRGIKGTVQRTYPEVSAVVPIGMGHVAMKRDIIRGQAEVINGGLGLGAVVDEGTADPQYMVLGDEPLTLSDLTVDLLTSADIEGVDLSSRDHVVHIDGEDRDVVTVGGDTMTVSDFTVVRATDGQPGRLKPWPCLKGSPVPVTPLISDEANGVVEASVGMLLAPDYDATRTVAKEDFRRLDHFVGTTQAWLAPEIVIRHYGKGDADEHVTLYHEGNSAINWVAAATGSVVELDAFGAETLKTATVTSVDADNNLIYVDEATIVGSRFTDGATLRVKDALSAPLGEVVLCTPAQSRGLLVGPVIPAALGDPDTQVLVIDHTYQGYDWAASVVGDLEPARQNDFLALFDTATGGLYGVFRIHAAPYNSGAAPPAFMNTLVIDVSEYWPGVPDGSDTGKCTYSWVVIDGTTFGVDPTIADVRAALFGTDDAGGEDVDYILLSPDEDVEWESWGFLDPADAGLPYTTRPVLTQEDVNLALRVVISDIPGGILNPTTSEGTIEIEDDEVHVGGKVDVYVSSSMSQRTFDLTEIYDSDPVVSGSGLTWLSGQGILEAPTLNCGEDLTGLVIVVEEGPFADAYTILRHEGDVVYIDRAPDYTEAGGVTYHVTNGISVTLSDPQVMRVPYRQDLNTSLSRFVRAGTPGNYLNFSDEGVVADGDHVLEILSGADKGVHTIVGVRNNGEVLELAQPLMGESTTMGFMVYKRLSAMTRPFVRIRSASLHDEDGADLGVSVPMRDPVDIRSGEMSNSGLGLKVPNDLRDDPTGTLSVGGVLTDGLANFPSDGVTPGDLVVLEEGPNAGSYVISEVNASSLVIEGADWPVEPALGATSGYFIGAPSIGTFRLHFLEPTVCGVSSTTRFETGAGYEYRPDPYGRVTLKEIHSEDPGIYTTGGPVLRNSRDMRSYGMVEGDLVFIKTMRLDGIPLLADSANVLGLSLSVQFQGEDSRTMRFSGTNPIDLTAPGYPGGVREQIEAAFPDLQVEIVEAVGPTYALRLTSARVFTITGGTCLTLLGMGALSGVSNENQYAEFLITLINATGQEIRVVEYPDGAVPDLGTAYQIGAVFQRLGSQRILSNEMAAQRDEEGFYYFDVDVHSLRPGNEYNLPAGTRLTVEGHTSLGYRLESTNEALTFSPEEELDIHLTPTVMPTSGEDPIEDAVYLPLRRLHLVLDVDDKVLDVNTLLRRDSERIINNDPLAKYFRPGYLRLSVSYTGGATTAHMLEEIQRYLRQAAETGVVSAFRLAQVFSRNGVSDLSSAVEVVVVVHEDDRSTRVYRSFDTMTLPATVRLTDDVSGVTLVRS